MANPYTQVPINGYNSSPPPDDGSVTTTNKITWSGIKTKLADPLDTALADVDDNVAAAFLLSALGGLIAGFNTNYIMASNGSDQGKTLHFTGAGPYTLTLIDATVGTNPFVVSVENDSAGLLTITPHGTQTINGGGAGASIMLGPKMGGILLSDGSNFIYIGPTAGQYIDSGAKTLFFTGAPTGWAVDSTINDAGIQLVSGTPGVDAGSVAFSSIFTNITIAKANLPSYNMTITDPGHAHSALDHQSVTANTPGGTNIASSALQGQTTGSSVTGISVASAGSGTALNFSMKTAQANRCTKN